jgi:N-acetylneuraminic acid mutarotase
MKKTLTFAAAMLCLTAAPLSARAADSAEHKQHAYDLVERNGQAIATVGDALYYYAELGMQEFESARFLKEALEASAFKSSWAARACQPTCGRSGARGGP